MTHTIEIQIPDIGGHEHVPVIELLVKAGDRVRKEQSLLTLESDKATMEVPSTASGIIKVLKVKVGDEVSAGSVIALLEVDTASAADPAALGVSAAIEIARPSHAPGAQHPVAQQPDGKSAMAVATGRMADIECQLLVLGSGPGGYSAAFRAADLGVDTVLVERHASLGGVCLNVGCIPSKTLLHAAMVIDEAAASAAHGVSFGKPHIELDKLCAFKTSVVGKLTGGLASMARQRKVRVVEGEGSFVSPYELKVKMATGEIRLIRFQHAIIAAGSQAVHLPLFPWQDERVMDSTGALELKDIPKQLLVVGGGIIGLEMATVYAALGSEVTVVEFMDQLIPGADADLVKPLARRLTGRLKGIHLSTRVASARATRFGIEVAYEGQSIPQTRVFDRVLVAVGRVPNGQRIGADKAGVAVNERGFIPVDSQLRTNVPHIHAIGDIVGQPMLAHKATHEAHVAAEVIAGQKSHFDVRAIPSVAYTNPEVAWVGVTEQEATQKGLKVKVSRFPWAASGRALGVGRTVGFTKLIFDEESHRIVGAGIVGVNAGELIAELGLAIEMGAEAADIALTVHPHPTLSESIGMAAEVSERTITDLYLPKKKA